jgi:hypothetical protein
MSKHEQSDKWIKWLLIFGFIYFALHAIVAFGAQPIIINQPDGGQRVCIVSGGYITCY